MPKSPTPILTAFFRGLELLAIISPTTTFSPHTSNENQRMNAVSRQRFTDTSKMLRE